MRAALDTNILVYAEGIGDDARCEQARSLIRSIPAESAVLPAQTLGELARVLTKKAGRSAEQARSAVFTWADSFEVVDSAWTSFQAAFDLMVDHQLVIWDALLLAVAAESHCRLLVSEDLQDGFTWRGVTVVNPFTKPASALLSRWLQSK